MKPPSASRISKSIRNPYRYFGLASRLEDVGHAGRQIFIRAIMGNTEDYYYKRSRAIVRFLIILAIFLVMVPILLRKWRVKLVSNGKTVATMWQPLCVLPFQSVRSGVYAGQSNLFSVWNDWDDSPLFFYVFPDHRRFLCVFWDDTGIPVCVADLSGSVKSATGAPVWPHDAWLRGYFIQRMTNNVITTNGVVRLPTMEELREASASIAAMSSSSFRQASVPRWDIGLYKSYWPKDAILRQLEADRAWAWP